MGVVQTTKAVIEVGETTTRCTKKIVVVIKDPKAHIAEAEKAIMEYGRQKIGSIELAAKCGWLVPIGARHDGWTTTGRCYITSISGVVFAIDFCTWCGKWRHGWKLDHLKKAGWGRNPSWFHQKSADRIKKLLAK